VHGRASTCTIVRPEAALLRWPKIRLKRSSHDRADQWHCRAGSWDMPGHSFWSRTIVPIRRTPVRNLQVSWSMFQMVHDRAHQAHYRARPADCKPNPKTLDFSTFTKFLSQECVLGWLQTISNLFTLHINKKSSHKTRINKKPQILMKNKP